MAAKSVTRRPIPGHRAQRRHRALNSLSLLSLRLYSSTSDLFDILFFGRDEFSCLVLQQLLTAKDVWQDIQIVTQPDTKVGRRGSKLSVSPLKLLAEDARLQVHTIPHVRSEFRTWKAPPPFTFDTDARPNPTPAPNHLLVTASFGRILPNPLLALFLPTRRLNVHPSLLPLYRGPAPIQHALIDGRRETGVCVIEMTERKKGIDSGAIWRSERMACLPSRQYPPVGIPDTADFPTLRDSLARTGGQLLVSVLRDMLAGKDTRIPQPVDPDAPRAPLITAEHSMIDFRTMTASRVVGTHRAISHQKPMAAMLKIGRTLQLHNPCVLTEVYADIENHLPTEGTAKFHPPSGAIVIRCAENTYLSVPQVRQQDRHLLKAKEWWNGVKPEMRLTEGLEGPVHFVPFDSVTRKR
ncbi:Formyltransferase [Dichomitus squalens]|uniref:methionyl-tRNA formyltransferase n=1 Tax=Dichomitus squalens TaxID=114155 RepID=A0A4Q9M929_9APHY|nr:Formyltransferase [Dichomitus squalens]